MIFKIKFWNDETKEVIIKGENFKIAFELAVKENVDFSFASLNNAEMNGAKMNGAKMNYAKMNYAEMNYAKMNGAKMNGAKMNGAKMNYANMNYASLNNAKMNYANMNGAEMNGADMNGAEMNYAEMNGAEMNDETTLDFSTGLSFKCSSFGIKASLRLAAQLLYHFERINFTACPEAEEIKNLPQVKALANKFHRVQECGKIK